MKIVVNLEKLSNDGYKMPANNPSVALPENIQYGQLRYDNFLPPNVIQGTFVSGKTSTIEFTILDSLLIWDFKLFLSTDGVSYSEEKTFGGTSGKKLTSSSLDASDFEDGEIPMSNGTEWIPANLSSFSVYEFAQSGTIYDLNDSSFISTSVGWICGNDGHILKTTNGTSFSELTTGVNNNFFGIDFVDANTGYVCGSSGKIMKTTNGGTTWSSQTSGTAVTLNAIFFIDSNTGWYVGNGGVYGRTTDGGATWTSYSGYVSDITDVYFLDSNTGYIVYGGIVGKSTNGGVSYPTIASGLPTSINSIQMLDSSIGYLCGSSGKIMKTTNGGTTWSSQTSGTAVTLNSINFASAAVGFACGTSNIIVGTTDGGTTWNNITTRSHGYTYNDIVCLSTNDIRVIGNGYYIYSSSNGGSSWIQCNSSIGRPVLIQTIYNGLNLTFNEVPTIYNSPGNYSLVFDDDPPFLITIPMPLYDGNLQDGSKIGDVVSSSLAGGGFSTVDLTGTPADGLLTSGSFIVLFGIK